MKRKVLLLVLVIILIVVLNGCGTGHEIIPPGEPEWMRAENTVCDYWQAITNRQYDLAKWYCINDGVWYNKVDEWEEYINTNSEGEASLIIYLDKFYKPTEVIEEGIYDPDIRYEAIAYAYVKIITHKIPFPGSVTEIDTDVFKYEIELFKQNYIPGDWELE